MLDQYSPPAKKFACCIQRGDPTHVSQPLAKETELHVLDGINPDAVNYRWSPGTTSPQWAYSVRTLGEFISTSENIR